MQASFFFFFLTITASHPYRPRPSDRSTIDSASRPARPKTGFLLHHFICSSRCPTGTRKHQKPRLAHCTTRLAASLRPTSIKTPHCCQNPTLLPKRHTPIKRSHWYPIRHTAIKTPQNCYRHATPLSKRRTATKTPLCCQNPTLPPKSHAATSKKREYYNSSARTHI